MTASMNDIRSFVFTMLLDGGCDRSPMTEDDARLNMSEWDKEGVEYPEGMLPEELAHVWNLAVGENNSKPSDLEIRANCYCIPFHKSLEDIECAFLSDHVIPYRDHVIVVFYRYNNRNHSDDWCLAVYSFDTVKHDCEGMCTLRSIMYQVFDDPGCAMKVGIQIADGKKYEEV